VNVTCPSASSNTPSFAGAFEGSAMSLVLALPATFFPGFNQYNPATVSHPSSAFSSAIRAARAFSISA
jgi:hypothetical protein